jgi:predicted fused transcriptional regulator/phosphomethylpyrimidine kinase
MILIFGKDPRDVIRKTSILTDYWKLYNLT